MTPLIFLVLGLTLIVLSTIITHLKEQNADLERELARERDRNLVLNWHLTELMGDAQVIVVTWRRPNPVPPREKRGNRAK